MILGIDTSTKFLTLALTDKGKNIFNYKKDAFSRHSITVLPVLKRQLKKYNIAKEKIGLLAVGLGPGSFTGLRISLSIVKAMALVLKKNVVGIPSVDVIAQNAPYEGRISVILDARRGNIYVASYEYKNSKFRQHSSCLLVNFRKWASGIKGKMAVLGDAVGVFGNELAARKNILCLPEEFWYPRAENLCALAGEKFKKQGADNIEKLSPLYLYPKECQIKSAASH